MSIKLTPQATAYWFNLELSQADVQPELQECWDKAKVSLLSRMSGAKGPVSQVEAEASMGLYGLYQSVWDTHLYAEVRKDTGRRICFVAECKVDREGDRYAHRGMLYLEPLTKLNLKEGETINDVLGKVKILGKSEIPAKVVDGFIEDIRKRLQYSDGRMLPLIDGKPLAEGDVVKVETHNTMAAKLGSTAPSVSIVVLGPLCPPHIKEALLGKSVGDDVVLSEMIEDGGPRKVQVRLKVKEKLSSPPLPNEELQKHLAVNSWEEVRNWAVARLREKEVGTFSGRLFTEMFKIAEVDPIPAAAMWDRAEGYAEYMAKKSNMTEQLLYDKSGGRDALLQRFLPSRREEYVKELLCVQVAELLGILPDDEASKKHAASMGLDSEAPSACYLAFVNLCIELVLDYYERRATEDQPRVVLTGSLP